MVPSSHVAGPILAGVVGPDYSRNSPAGAQPREDTVRRRRAMSGQRVVLAGGSGFLGRILAGSLTRQDYEVIVLSRNPGKVDGVVRQVQWDGRTTGAWVGQLEGARAVVNLSGRSVN